MFGGDNNLEKQLFNLKFAAKNLERNSKKCKRDEEEEKMKLKNAIKDGNTEKARSHAENAIRKKNESLNFLKTSERVDALASRAQEVILNKRNSGRQVFVHIHYKFMFFK